MQSTEQPQGLNLRHEGISRQLDLVPPAILNTPITIVGAGAIGSWVALGLAKSGFEYITVFDHDTVDAVNMSSQFYGRKDIGQMKVDALANRIYEMAGTHVLPMSEKFSTARVKGILIMAVDSMAARKEIFTAQIGNLACDWVIDARMGAEMALLYTVNPNDPESVTQYTGSLYSDADASPERCTAKSTGYCALVLSGMIIKTVKDVLTKGKYIRNLAFSLKESDYLSFTVDLRPKTE